MEETATHHQRSGSYNACSSSISRSRSGNLDLELLEAGKFVSIRSPGDDTGKNGGRKPPRGVFNFFALYSRELSLFDAIIACNVYTEKRV